MVEAPKSLTYASVVSRESVRIALTLAHICLPEEKTQFSIGIGSILP